MLQSKDAEWLNGHKNKTHIYATSRRHTSDLKTYTELKVRGLKKRIPCKYKSEKARTIIFINISDQIDIKTKT